MSDNSGDHGDVLDQIRRMIEVGQLESGLLRFSDLMTGLRGQIADEDINVVAIQRGQFKEIQREAAAGALSFDEKQRLLAKLAQRVLSHIGSVMEAVRSAGVPQEVVLKGAPVPAAAAPPENFEAEVNDCLMNLWWLEQGLVAARAVCKISSPANTGTGFVIRGGLVVTNNHVLPDREAAREASAIFNYEEDAEGTQREVAIYRLLADTFVTSTELDCSMVRIDESNAATPLASWGNLTLQLDRQPQPEDPVSIIQHPLGAPKRIALLKSMVARLEQPFFFYTTDTLRGSSGSPVLDRNWRVVGLHQAAGDSDKGKYVTNRGILFHEIAGLDAFRSSLHA